MSARVPVALMLVVGCGFAADAAHGAMFPTNYPRETQNFDSAASASASGWTGLNNTSDGNSFGFGNTNNTAGTSPAGEAGGTFARSTPPSYYADLTVGPTPGSGFNVHTSFAATGELFLGAPSNPDNNLELIGYFRTASAAPADPSNMNAGLQFQDRGDNNYNVIAQFALDNDSGQVPVSIAPGVYTWEFDYVAGTPSTTGVFTATIRDTSLTVVYNQTILIDAVEKLNPTRQLLMDGFGLASGGRGAPNAANTHEIFIDGLEYSVIPEPGAALGLVGGLLTLSIGRRRRGYRSH